MRTISTAQDKILRSTGRKTITRVWIRDSGGTYRDWTNLNGVNMVVSVDVGESLDDPGLTARIAVMPLRYNDNASPFWGAANRLTGYLDFGRDVKIEVAVLPMDYDEPSEWVELFEGRIKDLDITSRPMVIQAQDKILATIQERFIEDDLSVGTEAGRNIELVMQDILDAPSSPGLGLTLTTLGTPAFAITPFNIEPKPVLDALKSCSDLIGWDVRPMWTGSAWALTLYEPDRTVSSTQRTFYAREYESILRAQISIGAVRNVIRVLYDDGTKVTDTDRVLQVVERSDSASIAAYGRQWMEITEGSTSGINTLAEAERLADAILADLKQPELAFGVKIPLFWAVQLNDYYAFEADGERFDETQELAVMGYRHTMDDKGAWTELVCAGKPKRGRRAWLLKDTRPGQGASHDTSRPAKPATPSCVQAPLGTLLNVGWSTAQDWDTIEIHRSTTSGFTPSTSTLIASIRSSSFQDLGANVVGVTYYYKTRVKDRAGNLSDPSDQHSCTIAGISTPQLNGRMTAGVGVVMTTDQTETTSPFNAEFDASPAWGNSDYYNGSDSLGNGGFSALWWVNAELIPGTVDSASWRVRLKRDSDSATLWDSGDLAPTERAKFSQVFELATGVAVYLEVSFPGTSVTILEGSTFQALASLVPV